MSIQLYSWYLEMCAPPQLLLGALPLTNCDLGKWLSLRLPFHSRDKATEGAAWEGVQFLTRCGVLRRTGSPPLTPERLQQSKNVGEQTTKAG